MLSTSIASAIKLLLSECWRKWEGSTSNTIIPSTTRLISERIPTSNKTCLLIPYLKHRGDLVWCMLSVLTLCKRTVTRIGCAGYARLVVTHRQTVHQRNFAGSRTLSSFNSIIHYYTLHYWSVCITSMHAYIDCWCLQWLAS